MKQDITATKKPKITVGISELCGVIRRRGRNHSAVRSTMGQLNLNLAEDARLLIEKNFATIHAVEKIADELKVSYERLRKVFPRTTGISLGGYLHRVRIGEAKRLLSGDSKLYTIAKEVGYSDEVTLIRHWKKITGTTPKKYKDLMSRT